MEVVQHMLDIFLQKYKATVNLVGIKVMVIQMAHLFILDLNLLGYLPKNQVLQTIGRFMIVKEILLMMAQQRD